jgi:hypothetical protein
VERIEYIRLLENNTVLYSTDIRKEDILEDLNEGDLISKDIRTDPNNTEEG